jgi:lysophospholipase L1-like esterase
MARWTDERREPPGARRGKDDPALRTRVIVAVVAFVVLLTATAQSGEHASGNRVLVVGDSLLHGSQPAVQTALAAAGWQAVVDGRPGTSIEAWVPAIPSEIALAKPNVAVVELGTNDCHFPCTDPGPAIDQIMTTLDHAGVGTVLWMNVQETPWYPAHSRYDNFVIAQAAVRWPQMEIVDLRSLFDAHPEWRADGLHFNAIGQQEMAALIVRALHRWGPNGAAP